MNVIAVFLAATVEENILSYEPVITQECKFFSVHFLFIMQCKPVLSCL